MPHTYKIINGSTTTTWRRRTDVDASSAHDICKDKTDAAEAQDYKEERKLRCENVDIR